MIAQVPMVGIGYNHTIPPPKGVTEVLKQSSASVADIMLGIIYADQKSWKDTSRYARKFDFTRLSGFRKLWEEVRYDINYRMDLPGYEVIKSPSATWYSGYADCKSKSLFIASVLKNAGIPYFYRFAHYGDPRRGHVYVVAESPIFGEVILDSVHSVFNEEARYAFKEDYDPETGQTFNAVGALNVQKASPMKMAFGLGVGLLLLKLARNF